MNNIKSLKNCKCHLVPNQPLNQFMFKTLDDEIPFICSQFTW